MPLKPRHPDSPPKGMKWTYSNVEDGFQLQHVHREQLMANVRAYRRRNNYPIGQNFESDFDANICANATGNDCFDDTMPPIARRAVKFAQAMVGWASAGFPKRSQEEVTRILDICEGCEHFTGEKSPFRVACTKCGCSSKKLIMATESCPIGRW